MIANAAILEFQLSRESIREFKNLEWWPDMDFETLDSLLASQQDTKVRSPENSKNIKKMKDSKTFLFKVKREKQKPDTEEMQQQRIVTAVKRLKRAWGAI